MKKQGIFLFFLLIFITHFPIFTKGQQNGFLFFENNNGVLNFSCNSQCIAILGSLNKNDYLQFTGGEIQGNGVVGYGFLIGQNVIVSNMSLINGLKKIDKKETHFFSDTHHFSKIPSNAQVVLLVEGNISGKDIFFHLGTAKFLEKIKKGRDDFWKIEPITPYSINLRKGVKVLGVSIVKYGYIIFILVMVWIYLFSKQSSYKKRSLLVGFGIGIFLLIGLRNLITHTVIIYQGIKNYSVNQTLFDLGDYIPFTNSIRSALTLDSKPKDCTIQIHAFQEWPFKAHRESVYLKPCKVVNTGKEAKYILYYHVPIKEEDINKPILVRYNNNILLQNK